MAKYMLKPGKLAYNRYMASEDFNYQKLNNELDEILLSLQADDLDIDEAIKKYERGMEIIKQLQAYLKEAGNKVTKIKKKFAN
jgi:exodeoxyribonuclease VII small subunit